MVSLQLFRYNYLHQDKRLRIDYGMKMYYDQQAVDYLLTPFT